MRVDANTARDGLAGVRLSIVLNLASVLLTLPIAALGCFFLLVGAVTRMTIGAMFDRLVDFLEFLGDPLSAAGVMIALTLATAAVIYLMIRFRVLLPVTVLVLGLAALTFVLSATGFGEAAANPLLWAAAAGLIASAVQLRRALA
jgi:hypothetical protein